ncbi:gap-Pol polyprotein [Clonorchis sinensis]|uniref:Gap-Pol polyprotein n=1 Tax=Clonorchis sinensis TaxID=79923 RepID=G7YXU3_CLOSI|nr:gap-Pol polyprotein [Clonorchis sinensis]
MANLKLTKGHKRDYKTSGCCRCDFRCDFGAFPEGAVCDWLVVLQATMSFDVPQWVTRKAMDRSVSKTQRLETTRNHDVNFDRATPSAASAVERVTKNNVAETNSGTRANTDPIKQTQTGGHDSYIQDEIPPVDLDTGSNLSKFKANLERNWKTISEAHKCNVRNASGESLEPTGKLNFSVTFKVSQLNGTCYLTNHTDLDLFGLDLIIGLQLLEKVLIAGCDETTAAACTVFSRVPHSDDFLVVRVTTKPETEGITRDTVAIQLLATNTRERQPLNGKNKPDPGNLGESLDPVYHSVNP